MPPGQWQAINLLLIDELVEVGVAENCEGLTLMEDGAPIHFTRSQEWHDRHQIHKLSWPPSSPDLNPIKNLSFKMKNIVTHLFNPKSTYKLAVAINAVWDDLPFDHLELLLQSCLEGCKWSLTRMVLLLIGRNLNFI
ncbi:hypothetical protein O181_019713 [Austropuccinia psidii MF-1]|uniref:Tc1-like transposase DDE domain-containing protein n=1 Tax=Austropuccinia psidii MF-1 TaxID=1389203 RepID=A0A9Q3CBJ8_9BASI|nr:hypothetical protein [Austropuccinia psidii MF-1]